VRRRGLTASVTGGRGNWRKKLPDAEFAVGAESPGARGKAPARPRARGVGWFCATKDNLWFLTCRKNNLPDFCRKQPEIQ